MNWKNCHSDIWGWWINDYSRPFVVILSSIDQPLFFSHQSPLKLFIIFIDVWLQRLWISLLEGELSKKLKVKLQASIRVNFWLDSIPQQKTRKGNGYWQDLPPRMYMWAKILVMTLITTAKNNHQKFAPRTDKDVDDNDHLNQVLMDRVDPKTNSISQFPSLPASTAMLYQCSFTNTVTTILHCTHANCYNVGQCILRHLRHRGEHCTVYNVQCLFRTAN